jgi:hypothetical protein
MTNGGELLNQLVILNLRNGVPVSKTVIQYIKSVAEPSYLTYVRILPEAQASLAECTQRKMSYE